MALALLIFFHRFEQTRGRVKRFSILVLLVSPTLSTVFAISSTAQRHRRMRMDGIFGLSPFSAIIRTRAATLNPTRTRLDYLCLPYISIYIYVCMYIIYL